MKKVQLYRHDYMRKKSNMAMIEALVSSSGEGDLIRCLGAAVPVFASDSSPSKSPDGNWNRHWMME